MSAVLGRRLPGRRSREDDDLLAAFATDHGLDYAREVSATSGPPSLVLTGPRENVVTTPGAPYVEMGNHGPRQWYQPGSRPLRRGYVAVRHDVALPHVFAWSRARPPRSSGRRAADALAVALLVDVVTGGWKDEADGAEGSSTPLDEFRRKSSRLRGLPAKVAPAPGKKPRQPYRLMVEPGREDAARALVTGPAAAFLGEVAPHVDVELRDSWVLAYSCAGELDPTDPGTWAWGLSVAERMLELTDVLRAGAPA